ncbi:RNA-directed DNA polymerase from mobile element jockey-like [Brachionus plicatilis]|uniref:RNA-directed DNA polymerase from mobile element jockey-like n=1 Tax=Brachionus plicatilis TaxID=10195 RepID=A0A3M7S7H5_BRAPC|nr:RNA-directed DNA polymerase from mobile element jockey-like [Brachionus plicatilis]
MYFYSEVIFLMEQSVFRNLKSYTSIANKTNCQYSLHFADDLIGNLENRIKEYLKKVEKWISKWKMKIYIEKSFYMIFEKKTKVKINPYLKIYGKVKFFGITLDSKLTFSPMVDELKERFYSKLRILSDLKWGLKPKTLGNLYESLMGSILNQDISNIQFLHQFLLFFLNYQIFKHV